MDFSPVIIPTLNRYEHLKRCVESLLQNKYADKTELFIGLDFPPSQKYEEGYKKVCEYVQSLTGFKSVTVIKRKENMGAIENIKDLLKTVLKDHDSFIFSEDDNIFAPCFLEYAHQGLEKYKDDSSILSIQGFSYPVNWPKSSANAVKVQRYFSDWGFAMWRDRYEKEKDTIFQSYFDSIFKDSKKSKILQKKSRKNFIYAFGLCSPAPSEKIRPMDYTSSIYQCVENLYSIMPKETLVKNEGWDNSGIHCQSDNEEQSQIAELFINQKLTVKSDFAEITVDENETEKANRMLDRTIIGNYDRKYYPKVCVKAFLFKLGILNFVRKMMGKGK